MMKILILTLCCLNWTCIENGGGDLKGNKEAQNPFMYGVASGDPNQESVVLWTKIRDNQELDSIPIMLHLSKDSLNLFEKGETYYAHKKDDYTLKVHYNRLESDTYYYYAFSYAKARSVIGRTRTLPIQSEQIKLAFVSCSHFETGYFNVYDAISKMDDLHAIVHLGDYIYEGAPAYPDGPRSHQPPYEIISLQDYRERYAQYRSDKNLQKLHQMHPMINIWDDHEVADNWRSDGSHVHDDYTEGAWDLRKQNAKKVFFEWLPIHTNAKESLYRSFKFGHLATLMMLDTRTYRTGVAKNDQEAQSLEMLGNEQFIWLSKQLKSSLATWNILGNQVPFVNRNYEEWYPSWKSYDLWYGYPQDQKKMEKLFQESQKNLLIATGDSHSAFYSLVLNKQNAKDTLGREFVTASVTSKTWEEGFYISHPKDPKFPDWVNQQFSKYNPQIPWFDLKNHGFVLLILGAEKAIVEWYVVSTILEKRYQVNVKHKEIIPAKF